MTSRPIEHDLPDEVLLQAPSRLNIQQERIDISAGLHRNTADNPGGLTVMNFTGFSGQLTNF